MHTPWQQMAIMSDSSLVRIKKEGEKRGEIDPLTGGSVVINNGCVGCDVDHRLSATLFCAMKV